MHTSPAPELKFKDIRSWWLNQHFDRPGRRRIRHAHRPGCRRSKPFWFTELGCPAVDKGANQPNVFVDPKSSESSLPYYSHGTRDDFMQRRYLQAFLTALRSRHDPDYVAGANPASGRLRRPHGRSRPPARLRLGRAALSGLPRRHRRLGRRPPTGGSATGSPAASPARRSPPPSPPSSTTTASPAHDAGGLTGMLAGLVIDRVLSAREALQPLELAFFLDARESDGRIVFAQRGAVRPPASPPISWSSTRAGPGARHPHARAGDRPAGLRQAHLHLRRRRLSGRRRGGPPPRRPERPRRRRRSAAGAGARAGRPHGRDLAVRGLGRARACLLRAAAEPPGARAGRRRLAHHRRSLAPAAHHRDRRARRRATSMRAASIPTSTPAPRRRVRRAARRPDRHRRPAARAVPRPAAAARRRAALRRLRRCRPEPLAGRHRLLPLAGKLGLPAQGLSRRRQPSPASRSIRSRPAPPPATTVPAPSASSSTRARSPPSPSWPSSAAPTPPPSRTPTATGRCCSSSRPSSWRPSTYELSLLPARPGRHRGRHALARSPPAPASSCSTAPSRAVDMAPGEIGLAYTWRCGPANRDIGNPSYVETTHAFTGEGLRPLSPAHVRGRALRRRSLPLLGAPHPHRRRQLGRRRGAARRGQRALRDRHPRRHRPSCARSPAPPPPPPTPPPSRPPTSAPRNPRSRCASTSSAPPSAAARPRATL